MGVLLVPNETLWEFENVFLGYRRSLSRELGIEDNAEINQELKSSKLRSISKDKRIQLLKPWLDWADSKNIAVGGFYTTTQGYVNYNVRNEVAAEHLSILNLLDPERIKLAREDILARRASTHAESMMIGDIAQVIAGILLHYCGERNMKFTLHYDPRSESEDKKIFERVDMALQPLEKIILGKSGVYLGCSNDVTSRDSCGLQMVDYLTRDLRTLFQEHSDLLSLGAKSELVTAAIGDSEHTIPTKIGERIFKWGQSAPMPDSLPNAIFSPQAKFSIGDYHSLLMANRLSCYSQTGEAQIINFQEFLFETMVD